jgi:TolB-like protein/DNA-binding winged helix-turn-helix (wHTH) protein
MPAEKLSGPVQVGDWLVDAAVDTISRPGETQKLEPRTMRLLMCLIESAGAVVSLDKLLSDVWTGVIVGPASVYQAVSQLRKILGDTDPQPTYIATVPRKGYRLIATVRPMAPPVPAASAGEAGATAFLERRSLPTAVPAAAPATVPTRKPRLRGWLYGGVGLMALAAIAWVSLPRSLFTAQSADSIVVLPFIDMTAEKTDQPFCDGLTEELSNWLAQIPSLRVVARTSAFAVRAQSKDIREIGRTLDTNHVIEGSMRKFGDHMRVTVQLIDARNGYHLWSANYDRPMDDTIKMQEDISRSVAQYLQIRLTRDTDQRFAARRTADPQLYQTYLLAHRLQHQRTREATEQAIELYKQVFAADPKFALAYVGLSYALLNKAYFDNRPVSEVAPEVESHIAAALCIDAQLSDAYAARGALRDDQYRFKEALDDLRRAIALNPSDSTAFREIARILLSDGQPRESLSNSTHAAALDPLDFTPRLQQCTALQDLARYAEAEAACEHARRLQPDSPLPADELAWLAAARGRLDDALRWNTQSLRAASDNFDPYWSRATIFLNVGLAARARQAIEQGRAATHDDDSANAALAGIVYCERGPEALREYLTAAQLEHSPHAIDLLEAAYSRLLLGDAAAVKELVGRALTAPDYSPGLADSPWYARIGTAYRLDLAAAELATGDRAAALHELATVQSMLDRMIHAGVERHWTYELRARTSAMQGQPDAAMRDLQRAAQLGWRRVWWAEHEPYLRSLRSRSDYRALMNQVTQSNDQLLEKLRSIPDI